MNRPFGVARRKISIKTYRRTTGCEARGPVVGSRKHGNGSSGSIKGEGFLCQPSCYQFLKKDSYLIKDGNFWSAGQLPAFQGGLGSLKLVRQTKKPFFQCI
jgi:hypothetical protein